MDILYIDACIRGDESRTAALAHHFLNALTAADPHAVITMRHLSTMDLHCLVGKAHQARETAQMTGDFSDPAFNLAKEFAAAQKIVVAAPFWDLSFPAVLRVYLENVACAGIAFNYTDQGSVGCCAADRLLLITTRGGIYSGDMCHLELATPYLSGFCQICGIDAFSCLAAEGLDIQGLDAQGILGHAMAEAEALVPVFLSPIPS